MKNLSLIYDPKTKKLKKIDDKMNGNGTGDPGFGIHASFSALIM